MKEETKEEIKRIFIDFARREIPKIPLEELKRAYPFHTLFFDNDALRAFKAQRTIVTRMGDLYIKVAEIVAQGRFQDVHTNHTIVIKIEEEKANTIRKIVEELRRKGRKRVRKPNIEQEMKEILEAKGGEVIEVPILADLYVGDFKPGPLFMEIKSPLPNLDVCAEAKTELLYFRSFYHNKNPQTYFALPYNPFIRREDYKHSFTKRIMDMNREVLIGEEMWDTLGGKGTYNELLQLIKEAKEKID